MPETTHMIKPVFLRILAWVSLFFLFIFFINVFTHLFENQAVCSIIYRPLENTAKGEKVATSTLQYGKDRAFPRPESWRFLANPTSRASGRAKRPNWAVDDKSELLHEEEKKQKRIKAEPMRWQKLNKMGKKLNKFAFNSN